MRIVNPISSSELSAQLEQMELFPIKDHDLEVLSSGEFIAVFFRGFCIFNFGRNDRFSRNYCLVQLHLSGGLKLKKLSEIFGLNYFYCSKVLARYKESGLDGLKEETHLRFNNRKIINDEIGEVIIAERKNGLTYEEISQRVFFLFKKKLTAKSIRNWQAQQGGISKESDEKVEQIIFDVGQPISDSGEWRRNIYAGSMILYSMIDKSGFLRPFEEYINEEFKEKHSLRGIRRVLLTLFFLHALRCRSIEQSKHISGIDFSEIVGGEFLRMQPLRYAVDGIIEKEGFAQAIDAYYKNLISLTERGDRIYYTDGHFSTYYGKRHVPKGYDPRRQMPYRGRNTIYFHNSLGENIYLFESATNTSLSSDIEKLVRDMENLGMILKRKTLIFDRGGYSKKCFSFLKSKKLYFVTYLKNRKKEREVPFDKFKEQGYKSEDGEEFAFLIYELERRWIRNVLLRVIIFIGADGRQIPILTSNPFLNPATIIYYLQRRWREENSFKYMIEHFGIDLLTSYKTEDAPDKKIKRQNPARQRISKAIQAKRNELQKLRSQLAEKMMANKDKSMNEIFQIEKELENKIKNTVVDLDFLLREREKIPSKTEINLRDDHVIMAQKRRLLINAIKAMNYNAEKWLQLLFREYHQKADETLSLIRNLWRHPGRLRVASGVVEVELEALDYGPAQKTLQNVLKKINQTNNLRLPDGKILRISCASK